MSRSVLYFNNDTSQTVPEGGTIALGNTIRRYGCNCTLNNSLITLNGTGYYDISATVTLTPSEVGTVVITAYQDSNPVPGMTTSATVAATDTTVTVPIIGVVRNTCCQEMSNIKFVLTGGAASVTNISGKVLKT